jgi:hypothetical protein
MFTSLRLLPGVQWASISTDTVALSGVSWFNSGALTVKPANVGTPNLDSLSEDIGRRITAFNELYERRVLEGFHFFPNCARNR